MNFIIYGSVKEQFDGFYFMKGIGNVINPHDIIYGEASKAVAKSVSDVKVMEIDLKVIMDLIKNNAGFRKQWYKSVFQYALKMCSGARHIEKQFSEKQLRRFIEGSQVVELKDKQILKLEDGGYVF